MAGAPSSSSSVSPVSLPMLGISLSAILILSFVAIWKYQDVKDLTSVLGLILPTISTIVAAAFGVSVGSNIGNQAGQKAGQASVEAAKQQVLQTKNVINPILSELQQAHLNDDTLNASTHNKEKIQKTKENIVRIQTALDTLAI